jgi:hypothetical protein
MIITHESGSQEDQFDVKKWRQKISWDYPFKYSELLKAPLTLEDGASGWILYQVTSDPVWSSKNVVNPSVL